MKLSVFVPRMRDALARFDAMPVDALSVCVSTGNNKIGKVLNVSLPPVFTCPSCAGCARECYDIRDCRYKNVLNARARNLSIMRRDMNKYFSDIENAIIHHPTFRAFRWHVGGDIPAGDMGAEYFRRMIECARKHPDVRMWTYTKNYYVVNEYVRTHGGNIADAIPENMSIMFSQWRGIPMYNPYGFAEFRAYYDDEIIPVGIMECTGDCRVCMASGIGCPFRVTVWTRIRGQVKRADG